MNKQELISILKPTFKSFIKLSKSNKEETLTTSKIGGIPYWPKSKEYPKINKEPLKLIAQINESVFNELDAPPMRLSSQDIPTPYNGQLEQHTIIHPNQIVQAVKKIVQNYH